MERADDRTAALRAIAWVMVGWALLLAALGLAYELEYERMLDAVQRAPHRAMLVHLATARELVDVTVAALVIGIAALRRRRETLAPALAFAAVGLLQSILWLRPELITARWLLALRIAAGAATWLVILLALARLPTGRRARMAIAGAAAALVLWRYGVPLAAGLLGGLALPDTRPLLWTVAQAAAIVGVGGALAYLASGARVESTPGSWADAAAGLSLTATALVVRLCIGVFGFLAVLTTARWGLARSALALVTFGGGLIANIAAAGAMAQAARSPSRTAGVAAATTMALLLLAVALDVHAALPSAQFDHLPVAVLVVQAGVLLALLAHVRHSALDCNRADRAHQAAVLSYVVVAVGSLSGAIAAWAPHSAKGRALTRDVGFLVFAFALLAGVILILAITRTAHRLAGELEAGPLPPSAVARSTERSQEGA